MRSTTVLILSSDKRHYIARVFLGIVSLRREKIQLCFSTKGGDRTSGDLNLQLNFPGLKLSSQLTCPPSAHTRLWLTLYRHRARIRNRRNMGGIVESSLDAEKDTEDLFLVSKSLLGKTYKYKKHLKLDIYKVYNANFYNSFTP